MMSTPVGAPVSSPTPGPDQGLKTIVDGTPLKVIIRDTKKIDHELQPLDLSDIVEYEDRVGGSILDVNKAMKLRDIVFLVYLSLRKEGCTPKDIEERNFKYTERQVSIMFDMGFFRNSVQILLDILRVSGFTTENPKDEKPGVTNPTKAADGNAA